MRIGAAILVLSGVGLAGCIPGVSGALGERELRPPRAGIQVGSLYYVRERPTNSLSRPANLERLCSINLDRYAVSPQAVQVVDIDLLRKLDVEGSLDGIKNEFFSLGLSGNLNNHYEYKLTNVKRVDISYVEAERIFQNRGTRQDCLNWRGNIASNGWGIYQIQSISIGDIQFSRKSSFGLSAEASAKIKSFEPRLKASIKRSTGVDFSGKGMVASFGPIVRN
jgi:hypothetical protein